MSKQFSVQFTKRQIEYLMLKLGSATTDEAIETFMTLISEERVDPLQAPLFVKKLMEKDGNK